MSGWLLNEVVIVMKQEDKDLLLKDICARLPYGVKCNISRKNVIWVKSREIDSTLDCHWLSECKSNFYEIKPYLFPLSSMTEEQKKEWRSLMIHDSYGILYPTIKSFDYLYKNHIDIRGLIPMGLAIDCTNLNIY